MHSGTLYVGGLTLDIDCTRPVLTKVEIGKPLKLSTQTNVDVHDQSC